MAGKITKRKLLDLSPSDIGRMNATELRNTLRGARQLFNAQAKKFDKYKETVWSPALNKMEEFYEERGPKAPSKMNMNQMRSELFHLQNFFEAETSNVPGARRVQREQDIRFFGADSRGRPKKRLNVEQRTKLWALYEEYKRMRPADAFNQSNTIQQELAQMVAEKSDLDFSAESLAKLAERLDEERSMLDPEMEDYEDGSTVFSGTRPY